MRIAALDVFPLKLPMNEDFYISGGKVGDQKTGVPHVYVRMTAEDGEEGWGEARPSHRWSYETLETVASTIRNYFSKKLVGLNLYDLRSMHNVMDQEIASGLTRGQPIAKAAVDIAIMDLIGKKMSATAFPFMAV